MQTALGVFTAIEGTLLAAETLKAGPNQEVVEALTGAGVPVVPVTVMTLEEIAPIARELGLSHAMIIEAGGAIARWQNRQWVVEPCGPDADTLLNVVREIEDRSGANLFVHMPEGGAARRFSEPFVIEDGDLEAVKAAAAEIGFSVRRGRRFLHLCRACYEGEAFTRVRDELGCRTTIAVGGSPLDAQFLSRADIPIIVPGADGQTDAELLRSVPRARIAPAPAPDGWADAVSEAWKETLTRRAMT
jgi:predicted mannosyl-3-phosphoglycerate phosphatase (HAD superfamily)